jgi:hypothetical protein
MGVKASVLDLLLGNFTLLILMKLTILFYGFVMDIADLRIMLFYMKIELCIAFEAFQYSKT